MTRWRRGCDTTSGFGEFRSSITRSISPPSSISRSACGRSINGGIFAITAEITQLVLGLSIPLWLASHFGAERLSGALFGWPPFNYASALYAYWVTAPYNDCRAVHFADGRMDARLYRPLFLATVEIILRLGGAMLLAVAVLMPPLAMIGAHHGGREVAELAQDLEWRNENLKRVPAAQRRLITEISLVYFPDRLCAPRSGWSSQARGARTFRERRRGMVTISYPNRQVRVPKGMSVLEASLRLQDSACQRVRRPRTLFDLPHPRCERP